MDDIKVGQQVAPGIVAVTVSSVLESIEIKKERDKYKDRLLEIERWLREVGSMLGGTEVDVKRAREAISETITGEKSPT
jgi:hypothetical protein